MNILVCIDDTDNLESRGTGQLAAMLAATLEESGWGKSLYVTRHQLLVHPDIPYTSHNSAMCFEAVLDGCPLEDFIEFAAGFLGWESAPGSDPGLCVVPLHLLHDRNRLIEFGRAAKSRVLTKEEAYSLAGELGIHLSEHGGSGQGVIGALAGVGLRLSGNDGRLRGRLSFDKAEDVLEVATLCGHPYVDAVQSLDGKLLEPGEQVQLADKVKTVMLDGRSVLPVVERAMAIDGIRWQNCSRQQLRGF